MVDWVLISQSKASRPYQSKLLFDKVGVPVSSVHTEHLVQRKKSVAEKWAFFWMMTAVTIKYILRDDRVFVTQWIENLHALIRDMERQMNGEPWKYTRGSLSLLQTTPEKQIESLKRLCKRMQELQLKVEEFTESQPLIPLAEIEILLSLAEKNARN